jgi:hypothetical protein
MYFWNKHHISRIPYYVVSRHALRYVTLRYMDLTQVEKMSELLYLDL